jgi:hypothetical protein
VTHDRHNYAGLQSSFSRSASPTQLPSPPPSPASPPRMPVRRLSIDAAARTPPQ